MIVRINGEGSLQYEVISKSTIGVLKIKSASGLLRDVWEGVCTEIVEDTVLNEEATTEAGQGQSGEIS